MRKVILHCGECEDFPCAMLDSFYKDGIAHHALACVNTQHIRQSGAEAWLAQQDAEHRCQCGRRRTWFAKECTHVKK
jgi:hypothetical protein